MRNSVVTRMNLRTVVAYAEVIGIATCGFTVF